MVKDFFVDAGAIAGYILKWEMANQKYLEVRNLRIMDGYQRFKASRIADDLSCYRFGAGNTQNLSYNFSTPAVLMKVEIQKILNQETCLVEF